VGAGLVVVAVAGLAVALSGSGSHGRTNAPERPTTSAKGRPNIVLIQADDETLRQFSQPNVMPKTKRLLAAHGTTFTDYVATTAQCCPSRASLLTGSYPHNTGVLSNEAGYGALRKKGNTLPVWLQRGGYRTMHVGKYLNGYENFAKPPSTVAPGWDQWYTVEKETHYYHYALFVNGKTEHRGRRPADNVTAVVNRRAAKLVKRFGSRPQPFYLQLDERAPHSSHESDPTGPCDHAAKPERRDEGSFAHQRLPKPPSFNERNIDDKPSFLRTLPRLDAGAKHRLRTRWRCALEAIRGVDRGVAHVYRAVQRAGDLQRTVFIFISDNGLFYGEHRIDSGKVLPYEEALRLPLVVSVPTRYRHGAPRVRRVGEPVANIDLAPTILALAGARPCPPTGTCRTMDGRSLMPLLTGSGGWPRGRGLLTEYSVARAGRYDTCQFAGIRTSGAIYVRHVRVVDPNTGRCRRSPVRERYDLLRDPFELHNLCFGGGGCPHDRSQRRLQARLRRLRVCAGIAGRDRRVDGRPFCE
jgi:arylsulfatase A-like enzyme